MKLFYKSHDGQVEACAEYENGIVTVKKGSTIRMESANHFKEGRNKAFLCRRNRQIVSKEGVVLEDCEFNSPSIAAQFIAGSVVNGNMFWHLENGNTLKKYLERKK